MYRLRQTPKSERRGMMQKDNRYIAFVCTGNTCRSPMAEGIFNKLAVEKKIDVTAESFGIATVMGMDVSDNSKIACMEIGVDLSGHTSTAVNDIDLDKYEKFYCMSQSHANMLSEFFSDSRFKNCGSQRQRPLRRRYWGLQKMPRRNFKNRLRKLSRNMKISKMTVSQP